MIDRDVEQHKFINKKAIFDQSKSCLIKLY